jgi:chemotaxis-related protein WspD
MNQNQSDIYDCWNRIGVWSRKVTRCPELVQVYHCRNCAVYAAVGRHLLNRALPPDYQEERTHLLAARKERESSGTSTAFIFRAGKEWLALPVAVVREVADMGPIHTIPHRNSNIVRGLVNIKGKLEICVSIGTVLEIGRCEKTTEQAHYIAPARLVITESDNQVIAFPVSEVKGIIRYRPEAVRQLPANVSGPKALFADGILHVDNKEICLLKFKPLFRALTRDLV